ncbi:MAG: hypothetical protein M2R45_04311 [Verrucomicrobia subdivision 3 bacterium]|nr:hypothetical protein [Limisphaerales bacterium]MCS1417226.1 hypothetical protein [Limisphaerales bacterium]
MVALPAEISSIQCPAISAHGSRRAVCTDEASAYARPAHEKINHSEYMRGTGTVYTNGVESFWLMLKRAYKCTFHKISPGA